VILRVRELLAEPAPSRWHELVWWQAQRLQAKLMPDEPVGVVDTPGWTKRADTFPPEVREALRPVLEEADRALSVPWHVCPLCGRPFPLHAHAAKACPPCRRRYTRREVERRLARAPRDPIVFEVAPEGAARPLRPVIADGVEAPPAVRRLASPRKAERCEAERIRTDVV
jgi:hypothetical protein